MKLEEFSQDFERYPNDSVRSLILVGKQLISNKAILLGGQSGAGKHNDSSCETKGISRQYHYY